MDSDTQAIVVGLSAGFGGFVVLVHSFIFIQKQINNSVYFII